MNCWGRDVHGQVAGTPSMRMSEVQAGGGHSCGIEQGSGQLYCWGWSDAWQGLSPTCNLQGATVSKVTAGNSHTCVLSPHGGTAECCGVDDHAQARAPAHSMTAIAAGWKHSCGIRTDQSILCWGITGSNSDNYGQVEDAPGSGVFVSLSASDSHNCAIDTAGRIQCWGRNHLDQATPPATTGFVQVDAGAYHSCAIDDTGRVHCWGQNNHHGQITPP